MTYEFLLSSLVTLLVIVDPVGLAPIFLSLTGGMPHAERRVVARRATLVAFGILIFFAAAGELLLELLGIGLPAFRIGGGLLLFWIAFEMVFGSRTDRKQQAAETARTVDHVHDPAVFPLAIPLMAGPGAITAVILIASRIGGEIPGLLVLLLLITAVMAVCHIVFIMASRIADVLGTTGRTLVTRLLGVLLTALAVQFIVDGILELAARLQ